MKKNQPKLIIITGLSGSGKTIALHSLEDQGYFCIDNLSPNMILLLLEKINNPGKKIYEKVAVSIDIRSIKLEKDFKTSIDSLYKNGIYLNPNLIYLNLTFNNSDYEEKINYLNSVLKNDNEILTYMKKYI